MQLYEARCKKENTIVFHCVNETIKHLLTLPHADVAFFAMGVVPLSFSSSSAKPQEQFLQAFLFPVVPHTKE